MVRTEEAPPDYVEELDRIFTQDLLWRGDEEYDSDDDDDDDEDYEDEEDDKRENKAVLANPLLIIPPPVSQNEKGK